MSELPFLQAVLFPVDLRYGWNLLDKDHKQLLQRANKHYKPHTTTFELRNRNWNRTSEYDCEAQQKRQRETLFTLQSTNRDHRRTMSIDHVDSLTITSTKRPSELQVQQYIHV